jgi:hypothetical protein
VRAVRLGDGPKAPLRIEESELERYTKTSSIGADVAAKAERIVELRGADATDSDEYVEALREAGYAASIFAERVERLVHADMAEYNAGYRVIGADVSSDTEPIDVEGIFTEEIAKFGRTIPVAIVRAGPKGVDRAARRILRDKGVTEYDARAYRQAVRQAIRDLQTNKETV